MTHSFNIVFCANQESAVLKTIDYLKEKSYTVFFAETENDLLSILNNHNINLVIVELDFKNKYSLVYNAGDNSKNVSGEMAGRFEGEARKQAREEALEMLKAEFNYEKESENLEKLSGSGE